MDAHSRSRTTSAIVIEPRRALSRWSSWVPAVRIGLSFFAGVLADLAGAPQFLVLPTMIVTLAILHLLSQTASEPPVDGC